MSENIFDSLQASVAELPHPIDVACPACGALAETVCVFLPDEEKILVWRDEVPGADGREYHRVRFNRIQHTHTADPDITDESCDGCKALVEARDAKLAEKQERRAQRHVDAILKVAARIDQARIAAATSKLVTVTHANGDVETKTVLEMADPLILAAVIIADAIGEVENRLDGIEDRLCELRDRDDR